MGGFFAQNFQDMTRSPFSKSIINENSSYIAKAQYDLSCDFGSRSFSIKWMIKTTRVRGTLPMFNSRVNPDSFIMLTIYDYTMRLTFGSLHGNLTETSSKAT